MFQLKRVSTDKHRILGSASFDLTDSKDQPTKSYKTVIIGQNGTGKSSLLYFITDTFINLKRLQLEDADDVRFENDFEIVYSLDKSTYQVTYQDQKISITKNRRKIKIGELELPSKIIVSTLSITERFPLKFHIGRIGSEYNSYDEFYEYFGIRSRRGQLVQRQYSKTAINVFLNRFFEDKSRTSCADVFKKLGYEPKIEIQYRNPKTRNSPYSSNRDEFDIRKYISKRISGNDLSDLTKSQRASLLSPMTQERIFELFDNLESNFGESKTKKRKYFVPINLEGDISKQQRLYKDYGHEIAILKNLRILEIDAVFISKKDRKFEISQASSGEQQLLSTFLTLASAAEDNALVLLDEPDISLHPEWQSQFIELLDKTMNSYEGLHYILVTHSPYLISDLREESANILRLESKESRVDQISISDSTYGKSVEQITLDIFNMPTSRNAYLTSKVAELMNRLREKKGELQSSDLDLVRNLLYLTSKLDSKDPLKLLVNKVGQHLNVQE